MGGSFEQAGINIVGACPLVYDIKVLADVGDPEGSRQFAEIPAGIKTDRCTSVLIIGDQPFYFNIPQADIITAFIVAAGNRDIILRGSRRPEELLDRGFALRGIFHPLDTAIGQWITEVYFTTVVAGPVAIVGPHIEAGSTISIFTFTVAEFPLHLGQARLTIPR